MENVEDQRGQSFNQPTSNIFNSDESNIFTDSESMVSELSGTNKPKDNAIDYDKYSALFTKTSVNLEEVKGNSSLHLLQDYSTFKRKLNGQRSLHK